MEGESGPKARPKGVVDGKQVNIPVLIFDWYRGTKKAKVDQNWIFDGSARGAASTHFVGRRKKGRRKTILLAET